MLVLTEFYCQKSWQGVSQREGETREGGPIYRAPKKLAGCVTERGLKKSLCAHRSSRPQLNAHHVFYSVVVKHMYRFHLRNRFEFLKIALPNVVNHHLHTVSR